MMEPVTSDGDKSSAPLAGEAVRTVVTENTSQTVDTAEDADRSSDAPKAKPRAGIIKHLYWFLSGR
jgi:hypothetical protein